MTQLILISHGDIAPALRSAAFDILGPRDNVHAPALRSAAFDILGPRDNVHALALRPGDSPESLTRALNSLLLNAGAERAILLCDIVGGTPANTALKYLLQRDNTVSVVSGLNLPMLLALMNDDAVDIILAGREGILDIGNKIRQLTTL